MVVQPCPASLGIFWVYSLTTADADTVGIKTVLVCAVLDAASFIASYL